MINELASSIDTYLGYSNLLDDTQEVIFLSESENNINFLIDAEEQKYLFRLSKKSVLGLRNQIRYEYDALKTLEKSHVTPKTFFLDDSATFFEYGALIMQYIEGRPLEYKKDIYEAAKILAKIHSIDTEKVDASNFIRRENIVQCSLDNAQANLEVVFKSPKIDMNLKLKISEFLDWGEKNKNCQQYFKKDMCSAINHSEPHAKNFIISEKKKKGYLIDWKKPVISDPVVDIVYFLSPVSTTLYGDYIFSKDERDSFLKKYMMYLDRDDRHILERVKNYAPYAYLESFSEITNRFIVNGDRSLEKIINIEFLNMITKNIL